MSNDFAGQIKSIINIVEDISYEVEKNKNFKLIPELMNLLEALLPNLFVENNKLKAINNDDILEILNDIVNAFENNDSVLMTDVLRYGLKSNLMRFVDVLSPIKDGQNE